MRRRLPAQQVLGPRRAFQGGRSNLEWRGRHLRSIRRSRPAVGAVFDVGEEVYSRSEVGSGVDRSSQETGRGATRRMGGVQGRRHCPDGPSPECAGQAKNQRGDGPPSRLLQGLQATQPGEHE